VNPQAGAGRSKLVERGTDAVTISRGRAVEGKGEPREPAPYEGVDQGGREEAGVLEERLDGQACGSCAEQSDLERTGVSEFCP
jgi:hypothetical protein